MDERLINIFRVWNSEISKPHSKTKFEIIKKVKRKCDAKTFVETGTYLGVTARHSSKMFEKVFTIEISSKLVNRAKEKFEKIENIKVIQGDAVEKIDEVMSLSECHRALIFLGAYYSGGETTYGDVPEPDLEELSKIEKTKKK